MRRLALVPAVAVLLAACGDDGRSGDASRYCEIGEDIFAVNGELGALGDELSALGDAATPDDIAEFQVQGRVLLGEFSQLLADGAAVAPSDIRDAAVVLAEAFAVDERAEAGLGPGAVANPLDVPEVQAANDRVADWAVENC